MVDPSSAGTSPQDGLHELPTTPIAEAHGDHRYPLAEMDSRTQPVEADSREKPGEIWQTR